MPRIKHEQCSFISRNILRGQASDHQQLCHWDTVAVETTLASPGWFPRWQWRKLQAGRHGQDSEGAASPLLSLLAPLQALPAAPSGSPVRTVLGRRSDTVTSSFLLRGKHFICFKILTLLWGDTCFLINDFAFQYSSALKKRKMVFSAIRLDFKPQWVNVKEL